MQRNSSRFTLLLLALREIRLDNNIHLGQLAHATGKTPKEWESIETGKSPLTLQVFTNAAYGLFQQPSHVMWLAEQLANKFISHGWYFQPGPLGNEDDLLPLIGKYFTSAGYEALMRRPNDRMSVTALTQGNIWAEPTIVRYCCVQGFREWVDAGAQPEMTYPTVDMDSGL